MATQKRGIYGWICASCGGAIRGLNPSDAEKALAEKAVEYAGKGKMRKAVGEKVEKKTVPAIGKPNSGMEKKADMPVVNLAICVSLGGVEILKIPFTVTVER